MRDVAVTAHGHAVRMSRIDADSSSVCKESTPALLLGAVTTQAVDRVRDTVSCTAARLFGSFEYR